MPVAVTAILDGKFDLTASPNYQQKLLRGPHKESTLPIGVYTVAENRVLTASLTANTNCQETHDYLRYALQKHRDQTLSCETTAGKASHCS